MDKIHTLKSPFHRYEWFDVRSHHIQVNEIGSLDLPHRRQCLSRLTFVVFSCCKVPMIAERVSTVHVGHFGSQVAHYLVVACGLWRGRRPWPTDERIDLGIFGR
jgi:hypothetical protein